MLRDAGARSPSTRGLPRWALALAGVPFPGLASSLAGLPRRGLILACAASATLAGGAFATTVIECTCPVVVTLALFAAWGLADGLLVLRSRAAAARGARMLATLAVVAVLPVATLVTARALVVDYYFVPSDSMAPSLRPGDFILVNRLAHVDRGDVVVFRGPDGRRFVKRVAAAGGDRVEIRHGELLVNGEAAPLALDPDAASPLVGRYFTRTGGRGHRVLFQRPYLTRPSMAETRVPDGHLFVLGDNRDRSADSRAFGVISRGRVIGRAFAHGPRDEGGTLRWSDAGSLL